jgi:hypothetical protein
MHEVECEEHPMKNAVTAILVLVLSAVGFGSALLERREAETQRTRAAAAEAREARLEATVAAWDKAAKLCLDAITEAKNSEKTK